MGTVSEGHAFVIMSSIYLWWGQFSHENERDRTQTDRERSHEQDYARRGDNKH